MRYNKLVYIFLCCLQISLGINAFAQTHGCETIVAKEGLDSNYTEGVHLIYLKDDNNDSINTFLIVNNTQEVNYLYTGMLDETIYNYSPVVHQYDFYNKEYYLSITPTYGHFYISSGKKVMHLYDAFDWYKFVKVMPFSQYKFEVRLSCNYFYREMNLIEICNPYDFKHIEEKKRITYDSVQINNHNLRVAIFKSIDIFCSDSSAYDKRFTSSEIDFLTYTVQFEPECIPLFISNSYEEETLIEPKVKKRGSKKNERKEEKIIRVEPRIFTDETGMPSL